MGFTMLLAALTWGSLTYMETTNSGQGISRPRRGKRGMGWDQNGDGVEVWGREQVMKYSSWRGCHLHRFVWFCSRIPTWGRLLRKSADDIHERSQWLRKQMHLGPLADWT